MGASRFFCVIFPFLFTLGSLICIVIVMTAGLTDRSINMFSMTPKDLSLTLNSLKDISGDNNNPNTGALGNANITASALGLQNSYQVYIWNYCYQNATNNTTWCSNGAFNWAAHALDVPSIQGNVSAAAIAVMGQNVTIPHAITDALKAYTTIARWAQLVYIIALILTVLNLIVGIFGFCSRIASCLTYFVSALSSLAIIVASACATAASVIIVGAMDSTVKKFGVQEVINHRFLSITWTAVLLSVGGSLFWFFSSFRCAAHHPRSRSEEKGLYNTIHSGSNSGMSAPGAASYPVGPGAEWRATGYEPYRKV